MAEEHWIALSIATGGLLQITGFLLIILPIIAGSSMLTVTINPRSK